MADILIGMVFAVVTCSILMVTGLYLSRRPVGMTVAMKRGTQVLGYSVVLGSAWFLALFWQVSQDTLTQYLAKDSADVAPVQEVATRKVAKLREQVAIQAQYIADLREERDAILLGDIAPAAGDMGSAVQAVLPEAVFSLKGCKEALPGGVVPCDVSVHPVVGAAGLLQLQGSEARLRVNGAMVSAVGMQVDGAVRPLASANVSLRKSSTLTFLFPLRAIEGGYQLTFATNLGKLRLSAD